MNNKDLHGLMAIAMKGTEAHPPQIMMGLPVNEYNESWYWIRDGKFASLLNQAQGQQADTGSNISLSDKLAQAVDFVSMIDIVTDFLIDRLARFMMVPASDIDPAKPLNMYGVDSLVAVEVRNSLAVNLMVEVSVFEIMANIPIRQLAADLAGKSKLSAGLKPEV